MEQTTEYQEVKGNREVKSSLFAKIFSDKKELLELFNAVNGTEHRDTDELEINTIEGILYMTTKNDVSFLIDSARNQRGTRRKDTALIRCIYDRK